MSGANGPMLLRARNTWLGGDVSLDSRRLASSSMATVESPSFVIHKVSGTHLNPDSCLQLIDSSRCLLAFERLLHLAGALGFALSALLTSPTALLPRTTSRIVRVDHQDATATISTTSSPFALHAVVSRTRFFTLVSARTLQATLMIVCPSGRR